MWYGIDRLCYFDVKKQNSRNSQRETMGFVLQPGESNNRKINDDLGETVREI